MARSTNEFGMSGDTLMVTLSPTIEDPDPAGRVRNIGGDGSEIDKIVVAGPGQQYVKILMSVDGGDSKVVASRSVDVPEENIFTFENIGVPLSADTVMIYAQGEDKYRELSLHSDPVEFKRQYIAGVKIDNGEEKADAIAAEADFGIVFFGSKNSGNQNTEDPAFDPSSGETLRVTPPETGSAQMTVYSVDGQKVFDVSGAQAQTIEWDGRTNSGDMVKNGVYIVNVHSGSKVKSFPVMVVK
jgi:hypothetical protein